MRWNGSEFIHEFTWKWTASLSRFVLDKCHLRMNYDMWFSTFSGSLHSAWSFRQMSTKVEDVFAKQRLLKTGFSTLWTRTLWMVLCFSLQLETVFTTFARPTFHLRLGWFCSSTVHVNKKKARRTAADRSRTAYLWLFFFRPTPYGSRQVVYQAEQPVAFCKFP